MKFMKIHYLFVAFVIVATSCSSPKHFTDFNNYSFQADKKKSAMAKQETISTVAVDPAQITASTVSTPVLFAKELKPLTVAASVPLSKSEKKELKREVKSEIKRIVSEVKKLEPNSTQAAQGWDRDLKLAAIFGAIGFALGALFGVSEILAFAGAVAIIVAIVFLIRWLIRQ